MPILTLQFGESEYRIVSSNGAEGDLFPYGEPALFDEAGVSYMALFDTEPDGKGQVCLLPEKCSIIEYKPVSGVLEEDVDFADDAEDAEGAGGEGETAIINEDDDN